MDLAAHSVTFPDVALADLRLSHIETWIKAMQDRKLEATTIRTRYANVHNVLRAAVRDRFMARDIAERIRLPPARKSAAAMLIPTPAEVGDVIGIADGFAAFIAVCAFAGLQRGEASALRMSDVDFLRKEMRVSRQVQWTDDGQMEICGPKYGGERTVFIPDGLVNMLSEHVRLYRPGEDPDRRTESP